MSGGIMEHITGLGSVKYFSLSKQLVNTDVQEVFVITSRETVRKIWGVIL